MTTSLVATMRRSRIVPVITIREASTAVDLASALVAGGLATLEVTLRTDAALEAIELIAATVPEAVLGAGSVRTPAQYRAVRAAGARFAVSPGCTEALAAAALDDGGALVPGAATASEIMRLSEQGFSFVKFFPAQSNGGAAAIRALGAPLPEIRFFPTGGIDATHAADYLRLPNVVCIGGSWMVPETLIADRDWEAIETLALRAADLSATRLAPLV